jgi:putative ABC transport system permease protein
LASLRSNSRLVFCPGDTNSKLGASAPTVHINGALFTVVGVTPAGFQFPVDAPAVELWVTLAEDSANRDQRGGRMLDAVGRLKPGISPPQASAQMDLVASALARQFPEDANSVRTLIEPEGERIAGPSLRPLLVLWSAVGMLLLIACANVANLLLARNSERAREFALRAALGASRGAIVRQLFIEGLVMALLGAGSGVLLASGKSPALLATQSRPRTERILTPFSTSLVSGFPGASTGWFFERPASHSRWNRRSMRPWRTWTGKYPDRARGH